MVKGVVVLVVLMVATDNQELVDQVVVLVLLLMVNGLKILVNLVVDVEQDQVVLLEVQ